MLDRMMEYLRCAAHIHGDEAFLLGISGGLDSVVMSALFQKSGIRYGIAHCHFGLRGAEADKDAEFVRALASNYAVPFYYTSFDTKTIARKRGLSIQETARELRFEWFDTLAQSQAYDLIAVGHHKDDEIETFFINLLRGTGIHGLNGLNPRQGKLVHPLLFATRNELQEFASSHELIYREDGSNTSDKYLRNRIRNELLPLLASFRQGANQRMYANLLRIREEAGLLDQYLITLKQDHLTETKEGWIAISQPSHLTDPGQIAFIYSMISAYGFNFTMASQISRAWQGEPGRQFNSATHVCLIDRNRLIIKERVMNDFGEYDIDHHQDSLFQPIHATFSQLPIAEIDSLDQGRNIALVDLDRLQFPLKLRRWKAGDVFQPLGMQGKRKLSDFFVDEKLSLFEKETTWVVESAGKIAWIVNHRIDHRFRVTRKSKWVYRIEVL